MEEEDRKAERGTGAKHVSLMALVRGVPLATL